MLIFYIKYGIRSYLMKYKRSERLVFMTRHLTAHPNQLIPLTFFVEKFNQAKSSISEDIRIIKEVFENDGIGIVQTTAGAGGGEIGRASCRERGAVWGGGGAGWGG